MPCRFLFIVDKRHRGFTLIELMITVAIVGILAAVAIPVLGGYIQRSKASEAFTVLQGIRDKEEAYFGEYRRYTASLGTQPPGDICTDCMNKSRDWDMGASALAQSWKELGMNPDGPTYYIYQVTSPYNAAGVFNTGVGRPANLGTTWPGAIKPWFMARACGDLDCDGHPANYYISSANKNVFAKEGDGTY